VIHRPYSQRPPLRLRDRRGTEILEAAFIFLPLLCLTFGAIDYGFYFYVQHNVEGAAREGARAGIINGAGSAQINAAVANVMNACNLKGYSVSQQYTGANLQVTVTQPYTPLGIPPARVTKTEVKGIAVMRLE
jgi:Flp pilus assembly protein TadG